MSWRIKCFSDDKQKIEMEVGDSLTRTITMTASNLTQHQLPKLNITYPKTVRLWRKTAIWHHSIRWCCRCLQASLGFRKRLEISRFLMFLKFGLTLTHNHKKSVKLLVLSCQFRVSERASSSSPTPVMETPTSKPARRLLPSWKALESGLI